jgi:hypothetical protein
MGNDLIPEATAITELDQQVAMLIQFLKPSAKVEPNKRVEAAEAILMLQQDRKAMVMDAMARQFGSNKPS